MFVNGATPDGRAHSGVRRFAASLARAGYLVFIPELPGVAAGELSLPTLAASVDCAMRAADSAEARHGRIGLVGVSVGGTLALLTAASAELSARISVVACIAPFTDLEKVLMLATTGMYPGPDGRALPRTAALALGVARSLVGGLDQTPDARALGRALEVSIRRRPIRCAGSATHLAGRSARPPPPHRRSWSTATLHASRTSSRRFPTL